MAKLNQPITGHQVQKQMQARPDATVNNEGGLAFSMSPKLELYKRVATWMVNEPRFYDDGAPDQIDALIAKVATEDPEFILQLAAYARQDLYLRSAPSYILARSVAHEGVLPLVPRFAPEIVRRADEITEVLGGYSALNPGKNIPKKLKQGLDRALRRFDEYQLAKYDRKGVYTLRDALRVIRPKPDSEEQSTLWKKAVAGELATPDTWETYISKHGSSKQTWEHIMPKMGIMAILRNLRNFMDHGCDMSIAINMLTDPQAVARSKQFPYRFYSAYRAVQQHNNGRLNDAIVTAIKLSVDNLPTLSGKTVIACDNSGSMNARVSGRSDIACADIANLMGALAYGYTEDAVVLAYGTEVVPVRGLSRHDSPFTNMQRIAQTNTRGAATYAYKIIQWIKRNQYDADRIIVFTDEESYTQRAGRYGYLSQIYNIPRQTDDADFAPALQALRVSQKKPIWYYAFNLVGSGTGTMPEDDPNSYLIAGYSDKVLQYMKHFETDPQVILNSISNFVGKQESINPL